MTGPQTSVFLTVLIGLLLSSICIILYKVLNPIAEERQHHKMAQIDYSNMRRARRKVKSARRFENFTQFIGAMWWLLLLAVILIAIPLEYCFIGNDGFNGMFGPIAVIALTYFITSLTTLAYRRWPWILIVVGTVWVFGLILATTASHHLS